MGFFDIFSKRQRRERGEMTDVFQYENIPSELRVQVIFIWRDGFGEQWCGQALPNPDDNPFEFLRKALCREYGQFKLCGKDHPLDDLGTFLQECDDGGNILGMIFAHAPNRVHLLSILGHIHCCHEKTVLGELTPGSTNKVAAFLGNVKTEQSRESQSPVSTDQQYYACPGVGVWLRKDEILIHASARYGLQRFTHCIAAGHAKVQKN